jgi:hypothetical protein
VLLPVIGVNIRDRFLPRHAIPLIS